MKITGRKVSITREYIRYAIESRSGENAVSAAVVNGLGVRAAWMKDGKLVVYGYGTFDLPKKVSVLVSKVNADQKTEPLIFTIVRRDRDERIQERNPC